MANPIDVANKFGIAVRGNGDVVFLLPIPRQLSQQDALLIAAYIVALTPDTEQWKRTLQAVCNT